MNILKNIPVIGWLFSVKAKADAMKYLTPAERGALKAAFGAFTGVVIGSAFQLPTIIQHHQYNVLLALAIAALSAGIAGAQKYYSAHGDQLGGELLKNLEYELAIQEAQQVPAPVEPGAPLPNPA